MSDPRYTDPRLSDPVLRHQESVGGQYGWVAGVAVLALIAFLIVASLGGNSHTANNNSPAGTATRQMNPPSTTGSGATSPKPLTPAPAMPAPSKSGTQ